MTLAITKGMNGRRVETIGKYPANGIKKMMKDFYKWKNRAKKSDKYRICSYERRLYKPEERKIIIDFGDYSYFGLIKATKAEWKKLSSHENEPIDLEV